MLSAQDVRRVAQLTRIALTDEEAERLRDQLSKVLDHFQSLQRIDTSGVEPTGHATETMTVMREDDPRASIPAGQVLDNAPEADHPFFRVRPVLGA
ncbi:MAG: Asp-tRNA(Asn)/Glu-tRNA(Gln) amidotransferase subunit GatC [Chloroflexi bacterium]|nr:Asp-tRNA(Asn)/Glu-tRNA(Gln) amidotransferase subunit GatC [Chloroflexota bacterium]